MSTLFEAPALNPAQSYLKVLLLRLRRFVNRSVANMLESKVKDIGLRVPMSASLPLLSR